MISEYHTLLSDSIELIHAIEVAPQLISEATKSFTSRIVP